MEVLKSIIEMAASYESFCHLGRHNKWYNRGTSCLRPQRIIEEHREAIPQRGPDPAVSTHTGKPPRTTKFIIELLDLCGTSQGLAGLWPALGLLCEISQRLIGLWPTLWHNHSVFFEFPLWKKNLEKLLYRILFAACGDIANSKLCNIFLHCASSTGILKAKYQNKMAGWDFP